MRGRSRLIATIAIAVLVLLVFYMFFVRSRQGELGELRTEVEAEEAMTVQLRATLNRLRALQEQAPQLEAELAEIRELVPQKNQVPNFIFATQEAANEAGVELNVLTPELPKTPPEGAQLAEIRIQMGARGGYFAVQDFMRRLIDLDRALRIDIVQMSAEPDANGIDTLVSLNITARIFFELPVAEAPTTAPAPTDPAGSPATVPPSPTP
jgi:Tfp pilus assembly protein PilO